MRFSRSFLLLACAALLGTALPATPAAGAGAGAREAVIAAVEAVEAAGGHVATAVPSARSVVAELTATQAAALAGVVVTPDQEIEPTSADFGSDTREMQLQAMAPAADWSADAGAGVGVALIDSGVADLPDLAGRVIDGPDLSDDEDGLDRYGHGTFMAGLIAGDGTSSQRADSTVRRTGVAPSAHVVNVKVAGADGSTTLARLLVALDWVVAHRGEFNIKVVNLSFAADPAASWLYDPLALAASYATHVGLTVVAASGNDGGRTASPAYAPNVLAVGALDHANTVTRADDRRAAWSAQTPIANKPELLAPGVSTVSLRAPGSTIDRLNPSARVDGDYFRGSGTSMSTALTAGAVAVLAAAHPDASSAAVRKALVLGSDKVPYAVGGAVNLTNADSPTNATTAGLGRTIDVGTVVTVTDAGWTGTWTGTRWAGTRWAGTRWAGTRWADARWAETELAGTRWAGTRWAGTRWAGIGWTSEAA
jgi:serine protease AprX